MSVRNRVLPSFHVDVTTLGLAAIMVATHVGGIIAMNQFTGPAPEPPISMDSPLSGGVIAAVIVVESLGIVVLWRCWQWFPEWVRSILRRIGWVIKHVAIGAGVGAVAVLTRFFPTQVGPLVVAGGIALAIAYLARDSDYKWIAHNAVAFGFSICGLAVLGRVATPAPVIVLLVALIIWDYSAVSLSGLMDDLVEFSGNAGIPNYYIIPNALRIEYDAVVECVRGEESEKPTGLEAVIGVGDYVLPSLLVVTAASTVGTFAPVTVGAAVGSVGAIGVLHAALESADEGLPALVWLNSGAILGYGGGVLVGVVG